MIKIDSQVMKNHNALMIIRMWEQARRGISTIFVSSELEELLEVCNRILIMKEGRLIGEVRPEDVNINQLYALSMNTVVTVCA